MVGDKLVVAASFIQCIKGEESKKMIFVGDRLPWEQFQMVHIIK